MKRVFLTGLLGAIAMFLWTSLAHMVLPLGETGVSQIENEQAILTAMQQQLGTKPGLYLFPNMGVSPAASNAEKQEAMRKYDAKLAANPSGMLIYHPPGEKSLTPGRLLTEFLTELAEALLAVFLLAQTRLVSYGARLGFVAVVGLIAAITTNVPYWNWYGFPTNYTLAYMTVEFGGFVAAGLIAAALIRPQVASLAVAAGK